MKKLFGGVKGQERNEGLQKGGFRGKRVSGIFIGRPGIFFVVKSFASG